MSLSFYSNIHAHDNFNQIYMHIAQDCRHALEYVIIAWNNIGVLCPVIPVSKVHGYR